MNRIAFAMVCLAALILGGCSSGGAKLRELNQKIVSMDGRTEFSQEEFGSMLDYLNDNVEGVMTAESIEEKMEKYPYFANFLAIIQYAEMHNDLDAPNREKCADFMRKYHSYMNYAPEYGY